MFIRCRRTNLQEYFYLVEAVRDKEGRPRQNSFYLGKTLNLSAQEWEAVIHKAEEVALYRGDIQRAVRAYCRKHGVPLKTADAVRAAGKLIDDKQEEEEAVQLRWFNERAEKWKREHPETEREARAWGESLKSAFGGSDTVAAAARTLGVTTTATKDEVQAAFRKAANIHHPDRGGDSLKFMAVVEARDALLKGLSLQNQRV